MTKGRNGVETDKSGNGDLEPYYRLIEMQRQMIDLIQKNEHAERECAALREQLAREVEALARSRRSLPDRVRRSATEFFQRLLRRNGARTIESQRTFAMSLVNPFDERDASSTPQ